MIQHVEPLRPGILGDEHGAGRRQSGPLAVMAAIAFSPSRPTQKALTMSKLAWTRLVIVMGSATRRSTRSSGPSVIVTFAPRVTRVPPYPCRTR
jgi:hypothetical protein